MTRPTDSDPMSCVPVALEMAVLLEALQMAKSTWPPSAADPSGAGAGVGVVMESGELTGVRLRDVQDCRRGSLSSRRSGLPAIGSSRKSLNTLVR